MAVDEGLLSQRFWREWLDGEGIDKEIRRAISHDAQSNRVDFVIDLENAFHGFPAVWGDGEGAAAGGVPGNVPAVFVANEL